MDINFQNILDHYHNPRNFGVPSWSPTHTKKLENLTCGDSITFFLKINPQTNTVSDVAFQGEGCSIALGAASILSENLSGLSKDEIINLQEDKFVQEILGITLTPSRYKCATLALETVKNAVI